MYTHAITDADLNDADKLTHLAAGKAFEIVSTSTAHYNTYKNIVDIVMKV